MSNNEFFEFDLFSLEPNEEDSQQYLLDNVFSKMETEKEEEIKDDIIELFSSKPSIDPLQEGETVDNTIDDAIVSLFEEVPARKHLDIRLHSLDSQWSATITLLVDEETTIADIRAYLSKRVAADIKYSFYTNGRRLKNTMLVYALHYLNVRMNMTLRGLQQKKWKIKVHIYILQQNSFTKRIQTLQLSLQAPMQALYRQIPPVDNMVYEVRNHEFQEFTSDVNEINNVLWGMDPLDFNINILSYNNTVRVFPNTFQSLEMDAIRKYAMKIGPLRLPVTYHPNNPPPSTWKSDLIQAGLAAKFPNIPFTVHTSLQTNEVFVMPKKINVTFIPYCVEEALTIPGQGYKNVALTTLFTELPFLQEHEDNIDEFIILGAPTLSSMYNDLTMAQILEFLLRTKRSTLPPTIVFIYKIDKEIDPKTKLFANYTYKDYLTSKQNHEKRNVLRQSFFRTRPGKFFLNQFETSRKTRLGCNM